MRVTTRAEPAGAFSLELPDMLADETIQLEAYGPAGMRIGVSRVKVPWPSDLEIVLAVDVSELTAVPGRGASTSRVAPTLRITGRIIERAGRSVPAGLQVVLLGRAEGEPEDRARAVFVARCEAGGYFQGDGSGMMFAQVIALVAGAGAGIPVALETGRLPRSLPLVVDLSDETAAASSDCACADGDAEGARCARIDTTNRAIDEFDHFTVVRTTEPDIVSFTFESRVPVAGASDTLVLASLEEAVAAARRELTEATATSLPSAEIAAKRAQYQRAIALRDGFDRLFNSYYGMVEIDLEEMLRRRKTGPWKPDDERANLVAELTAHAGLVPSVAAEVADRLLRIVQSPATDDTHVGSVAHGVFHSAVMVAQGEGRIAEAGLATLSASDVNAQARVQAATLALAAATTALEVKRSEIAARARESLDRSSRKPAGRVPITARTMVDWDETPTFYQAAEIAHGHLLHFKQVWFADGFSVGDLLYSLPLAPGQKKLVSVLDWERREGAERREDTRADESLAAQLSADRDLSEIVSGALAEHVAGGSRGASRGIAAGHGGAMNGSYQGMNFGALHGISGGYGDANSDAWQDSARDLAASTLQSVRDKTQQSAAAVRSLRSTVVTTASQGESVRATTETVANHNHCHALTIQYFEVLRHFRIEHELADVRECLFVPLPMAAFDLAKVLRWRQELAAHLKVPRLLSGFDAARRVSTAWSQEDVPIARYADEYIESLSGELTLTISIPLPPMPAPATPPPEDIAANTATAIVDALHPTTGFLGVLLAVVSGGASLVAGALTHGAIQATRAAALGARTLAEQMAGETDPVKRYERFHHDIVPGVVEAFVDQLELYLWGDGVRMRVPADFTLVSSYEPGIPLSVAVRAQVAGRMKRSDVERLVVQSSTPLPAAFRAVVNAARLRYRTRSFEHGLVDDPRVNDDVDPPLASAEVSPAGEVTVHAAIADTGRGATLYSALDSWEQRRPRAEDQRLASELVEHLNDNFEYYHQAIWWAMDPNRRFMLLDGFIAPGGGGRSVASVVENRLLGIVGNCMVMPVAHGVHLSPRNAVDRKGDRIELRDLYRGEADPPPTRISLPTRGVFAEAMMGNCNSCEKIDDSRFWRWEDSPIDEPPAIESLSTGTRRAEPSGLAATAFPAPIVAFQNAPAAPAPTGLTSALASLGQPFTDITGLAGTQANAAAAYQQAMDNALQFGHEAASLAKQAAMMKSKDAVLSEISKAKDSGDISEADAEEHLNHAFDAMTFHEPTSAGESTSDPSPTPRAPRGKKVRISLRFRVFVPAPVWEPAPLPASLSNLWKSQWTGVLSQIRFNGDGRGFDAAEGTSRAAKDYAFDLDTETFKTSNVDDPDPVYGWAACYLQLRTTDVSGKPEWWESLDAGAQSVLRERQLAYDRNDFHVSLIPLGKAVEVAFQLRAKPYLPWTAADLPGLITKLSADGPTVEDLFNFVAGATFWDMDAQVRITFRKNAKGALEYTVTGSHDLFPAFELYVNDEPAYQYGSEADLAAPDAPLGLFDTKQLSEPPRTVK